MVAWSSSIGAAGLSGAPGGQDHGGGAGTVPGLRLERAITDFLADLVHEDLARRTDRDA